MIIDYSLTPEGMDAREEKDYSFLLGQGSVLPEIEEAVIGLAAGGTATPLTFAEDHRNEALRGKTGEATVTVKEVKEKILPALDDEFAKGGRQLRDPRRAEGGAPERPPGPARP